MYADSIGFWKVESKGTHVPATVVWEGPPSPPQKPTERTRGNITFLFCIDL